MDLSRRTYFIISIFVISFFAVGFFVFSNFEADNEEEIHTPQNEQQTPTYATTTVTIGDTTIVADIADTPQKRHLGLSGRESLESGRGMLFIFPHSDTYSFWMKDMHFSIDIIWINEKKEVVHVKRNATPNSYPESFQPLKPARYVLETNTGAIQNISNGQVIHIP